MHGVYDLTWAWLGLFFGWLQLQLQKEGRATCIIYFSTYNERSGRAGLQSDFLFLYTFCLELSSARVYSKN